METLVELSKEQKEIVFAKNIPIYVKASAGSGKTRVLTERVRYLLKDTKGKILALTFTNKASKELKERLSDIPMLEQRTFIGTFHAFCQKMLENHGYLIGLKKMPHIFEHESDRLEIIKQAREVIPSLDNGKNQDERYLKKALMCISKVKKRLVPKNELEGHSTENIALLYKNYQGILRSQNAIDFDDLLLLAYELLVTHTAVKNLYQKIFFAICVDEAQDINNAQYEFLSVLARGDKNILMVGDPHQSIFHFIGASPTYMDELFVKDFKPKTFELKENYRSSKEILKATQKIMPDAQDIPNTVKKGRFEMHCRENEEFEAQWVVDKIQELYLEKVSEDIEGEITYEKMAILARNKYLFHQIECKLKEAGLPYYYRVTPGPIQFESHLMKLFYLALRIKLNPEDILHKQKLLGLMEIKDTTLKTLDDIISSVEDKSYCKLLNLVKDLEDNGSNLKKNLIEFQESISKEFQQDININNEDEKNMIFNDIDELLKHWNNYAQRTDHKSLYHFRNEMAMGETHPLMRQQGVTLSTVHTMKGQEFDIVFLIGMDDGTFPDYRAIQNEGTEMTQEKNNLYVAFTRAKRFLYVTWPKERTMKWGDIKERQRSRFLAKLKPHQ